MGGEPIGQTWPDPLSLPAPRMLWAERTGRELSLHHHTRINVGFPELLARHQILGSCQGYVDPNTPLAVLMRHPAVVLNLSTNISGVYSPPPGPSALRGCLATLDRRLTVHHPCELVTILRNGSRGRPGSADLAPGAVVCMSRTSQTGTSLGIWDPGRQGHTISVQCRVSISVGPDSKSESKISRLQGW